MALQIIYKWYNRIGITESVINIKYPGMKKANYTNTSEAQNNINHTHENIKSNV